MSIFDVWLESWTITDAYVFGSAGLLIVLFVFVRPIIAERVQSAQQRGRRADDGT